MFLKMKKLILIGIVMFCLITLAFADSILKTYSNLGFEINETDVAETNIEVGCVKFNQLDTSESIRTRVLGDIDNIQDNATKWNLKIKIKPLDELACWSVSVNRTITIKEIIHTDKIILDELNNFTYSFKEKIWGTKEAIDMLESRKEHRCSSEITKIKKCVSISGNRCYLETQGKSPWSNCIGGKWETH